jgi:hypothetical protein
LVGWGIYLLAYRHPADYTEGNISIVKGQDSPSGQATSTAPAQGAPAIKPPADAGANDGTVTLEGRVFHVDLADTMAKRMRGLSGRVSLTDDQGMLFIFPSPDRYSFWMKDMKFAIDIVWISGTTVVDVTENVPPPAPGQSTLSLPMYSPAVPADKVLEINAGLADKLGIGAGDRAAIIIDQ